MRHFLFAAALLLTGAMVAKADDPKPAPVAPLAVQPNPGRPVPLPLRPFGPARILQLEEEVESLEANIEVKKTQIKAAEIGVQLAEVNLKRHLELFKSAAIPEDVVQKAKLEVGAAKVQVELRQAELKEVVVRLKYAKKRLENAKAADSPPAPGGRPIEPKLIEPKPEPKPIRFTDEKVVARQKRLANIEAMLVKCVFDSREAELVLKAAQEELTKLQEAAKQGGVKTDDLEVAKVKFVEAKVVADSLKAYGATLRAEHAKIKSLLTKPERKGS